MSSCTQCGAALDASIVDGLCPRCLLGAGMGEPGSGTPAPGWTPPTVESLRPLFPQLEVIELIGQGGMGAVYKARQPKLDRYVALKVLPPELGGAPQFAERFAREARTLARLAHPNIVGIHDFGDVSGLYYVVMEFVDGRSLRQLLQGGAQLRPEHALHLVPQICDGLQFAHEQGVVHRDVKPANILVDGSGRVRIADFGLAKLVAEAAPEYSLTGTHQIMGTLNYMAPEQMERPGDVDHRADIYALGVVFYEMLTGQLPIGHFPPPSKKANVAVQVDEVVLKSLEREPEKRYDSALEVKEAVERPAPEPPVAPKRERAEARPAAADGGVYLRILITAVIGMLVMFLPWGSMSMEAFEDAVFGERNSPDPAFDDDVFKMWERDKPAALRGDLTFDAWNTSLFGIPNGLVCVMCAVLAILAGISLGTEWRASWKAYGIPAAYGVLHILLFMVLFASGDGVPHLGAFVGLAACVVMAVSAWQLRPEPAPARRSRTTRRKRR